jgi:hypothetical protein
MDFITLKDSQFNIPEKYLNLDFLLQSESVNIPILSNKVQGYTFSISLTESPTKAIYERIISLFPEITELIRFGSSIVHGEYNLLDTSLMLSLVWIYEYYYNYNTILFLPIKTDPEFLTHFNETIVKNEDYYLHDFVLTDLESIEHFEAPSGTKIPLITFFGSADILFDNLESFNKRRLQTQFKKIQKKNVFSFIFSGTTLHQIDCLADMKRNVLSRKICKDFENIVKSCFLVDLLDPDEETYSLNEETFIETIKSFENKRVYLGLNVSIVQLKRIEAVLLEAGLTVSRKDNPDTQVVINSSKTSKETFLKNKYSVYILIFENITNPVDILSYLRPCIVDHQCDIYFDSSRIKNIEKSVAKLTANVIPRTVIKDSQEYFDYDKCTAMHEEPIVISDYYTFDASTAIQKMNLSNLSKNDYDVIRNFVKFSLSKIDIETRTCQLTTPCSPKDRRNKLNSLSNKISSVNYRCDVTCEIFKDYSIGVIVWDEMFRSKTIKVEKGKVYVYQTTNGNWKSTVIS